MKPEPRPKRPRGRPSKASLENSDSSSAPTPASYNSSSEYTTPLTSNVTTPVPSLSAEARPSGSAKTKRPGRIEVVLPPVKPSANKELRQSIYAMNTKRKREVIEDSEEDYSDTSPDAKLARKLQREDEDELASAATLLTSLRRSSRGSTPSATPPTAGGSKSEPSTKNGRSRRLAPKLRGVDASEALAVDFDEPPLSSSESEDLPLKSTRLRSSVGGVAVRNTRKSNPTNYPGPFFDEDDDDDDVDDDFSLPPDDDSSVASFVPGDAAEGYIVISGDSSEEDDADPANPPPQSAVQAAAANRRAYRAPVVGSWRARQARKRLEDHHPELKTMWDDLEKMPVLKAGKAEQPKSISRQLKPFQLEGLAWMKAMENTEWKGGLLGDEMGLGKTIQAVSLIMSDWPAKKPSLVLVPPVALMQWMTEIDSYTDGTLKTLVLHGTNAKAKNLTLKDVKKYDVIIMSYNSLESMYRKQEKGFKRKEGLFKEKSVIHATDFHRVILDEAHSIKTRTTMTAKACFALKVTYRWCLTGTPLQNRIGEFFSLVRFLNIRPFASYLCKQCSCTTLEWSMNEDSRCTHCNHGGMQHVSVFNQELLNPILRFGNRGKGAEAFRKLRIMTDRIMLRRLKKDHTNSMELPVKEINVERQFFGEEENDFANSIMTSGQRKFDTYVATGVLLNNYANIFGLIMQMRQVADHPDLILKKNCEGGQNILVCNICDEPAEDAIRSKCKHDFCRMCVKSYLNSASEPECPQCHIGLQIDLEQPEMEQDEAMVKKSSIINRIKMENWTSSSKIELLVHELHKLRSDNSSHKSIIFSQFTTMLQLIEWRLRRAGITTVMLDGSMTPAQRQASIEHFMKNVDVECFLVSLKAGGVALNLTEASRVFIVDPWWNPAALVNPPPLRDKC